MTFVKAACSKNSLGFMTSDFLHIRELNLASTIKHELLYKAVAGNFSQWEKDFDISVMSLNDHVCKFH